MQNEDMNTEEFTKGLFALFDQGRVSEVDAYFEKNMKQAVMEQDIFAQIVIYNEQVGFYRESSQYERCLESCHQLLTLMEQAGLKETHHYATAMLNVATAYRAMGKLSEAMTYYQRVLELYKITIEPNSFAYAELYNNLSLLYQELGEWQESVGALRQALAIAQKNPDRGYELATTYANLGASLIGAGCYEEAEMQLDCAIAGFEGRNVSDNHYAAALTAKAQLYFLRGEYQESEELYIKALNMVESYIGKTDDYRRIQEGLEQVRTVQGSNLDNGLKLSRYVYEAYGKPMLQEKYHAYMDRIAIGLVGEGSDCYGYDDAYSRDHDYGPGFCIWLSSEDMATIGAELQQDYQEIIQLATQELEQKGYHYPGFSEGAANRRGVKSIDEFFKDLIGMSAMPETMEEWLSIPEERLSAATNGEIFMDESQEISQKINQLKAYYPKEVWLRKLAQEITLFSQCAQYNYERMAKRKDFISARLVLDEGITHGLHCIYILEKCYMPHKKWIYRGAVRLELCEKVKSTLEQLMQVNIQEVEQIKSLVEAFALELLENMVVKGLVYNRRRGDVLYLAQYGKELVKSADRQLLNQQELAEYIAKMEFAAFDEVKNEGGRASCQDDWYTFRIMRVSQYLTWTEDMIEQYILDFEGNMAEGWNMITEKYGRMMESTTPDIYARLAVNFPQVTEKQKGIVEQIVAIQVEWMEEMQQKYPKLVSNARVIHTSEDTPWNTSYETYLRGELLTYSQRMLYLYGEFIANLVKQEKNLANMTLEHTVQLYGYESLEAAEQLL